MNIFSILQSPDDGTPIGPDLVSEGGIKYEMTETGVFLLDSSNSRPSDNVYASAMFEKWDSIVNERIKYYTGKKSIAGLLANWSYGSIRYFNDRGREWLLDIGCGDGAHVANLKDRSTYIGLDRNLKRLEIMKHNYPEIIAIYGDAATLPFRPASIKYVFSCNSFEHIWYLKDAIFEIFRCITNDGLSIIVVPTEGGVWNLGRALISKPFFQKHHPDIDFDFISHVEHCNNARQIVRSFQIFFNTKVKYMPLLIPTIMLNAYLEIHCYKKQLELGNTKAGIPY
jgi:ubiquinone/menaquinone biosynthesis C-methylase UbiE